MKRKLQLANSCRLYEIVMYHFKNLNDTGPVTALELKGDGGVTVHYLDEDQYPNKWHIDIVWAVQHYELMTKQERQLAREKNAVNT